MGKIKERWRKKYKQYYPKPEKFTYRGDGTGKIEFLVDGAPLFNTGPVAVDREEAYSFVRHMNSLTKAELLEFGQATAARFINGIDDLVGTAAIEDEVPEGASV